MGVFMIFRTCTPLFFFPGFSMPLISQKRNSCFGQHVMPVLPARFMPPGSGWGGDLQPLRLFLCSSVKPCSVHLACQLSGLSLSECLK